MYKKSIYLKFKFLKLVLISPKKYEFYNSSLNLYFWVTFI